VPVVAYQRLAQVCGLYLAKGSPVVVEGRLQMREWTTPQGARRQRLEVRAENVHFLERRSAAEAAGDEDGGPRGPSGPGGESRSHGQRA
jgi:single-strand DNA-binding protein